MIFLLISTIIIGLKSHHNIATVYFKENQFTIMTGVLDYEHGVAFGFYEESYYQKGWDFLNVNSTLQTSKFNDSVISYAAGYLEGFLTYGRIVTYYNVATSIVFGKENTSIPQKTVDFLESQKSYIMSQDPKDPYWSMAMSLYDHLQGVYDGYSLVQKREKNGFEMSYYDMYLIYSLGDIMDIMGKLPESLRQSEYQHCSSVVNFDPVNNDFYFSHTTWAWFNMNVRIFKTFILHFSNSLVKNNKVYFSSYPATPISSDDFYVTGTNLFISETTLSCYNESLSSLVTDKSLLTWQRVLIATRFAESSEEWMKYFVMHNSGTYNDEWVVFDTNKVSDIITKDENNGSFPENTIMIADQIPGRIDVIDVTDYFTKIGNYFPSYNVPYSKDIYGICAIDAYIKKNPSWAYMLEYDTCCRALIFKRDIGKVSSVDDMKKLIRYNNYTTDPLSKGDPGYAIASRWDLRNTKLGQNQQCGGALDGKVVSAKEWVNDRTIHIISSPTYNDNPVFQFDKAPICQVKTAFHDDMPDIWNFPWIAVKVDE